MKNVKSLKFWSNIWELHHIGHMKGRMKILATLVSTLSLAGMAHSVVHPLFPVLPPFLDGQTVLFSTWSCQRTHQPFQMCSPPSSLHHSLCLISQQLLRPDVLPETHLVKVSLKIIALYDSPSGHLLSLRKSLGCRGCTAQFSHH